MAEHLVLRRLLWALTSIVLLAGLLSVPVVGDEEDAVEIGAGATTTSSPAGVAGAPPEGDGGDAGPTDGGATTETTAAAGSGAAESATTAPLPPPTTPATFPPPPDDLGAPVDPGPPVPPRPGAYRYRTTGTAAEEGGEGESTTRIEERGRSGDETRLLVTTTGGELMITTEVAWRPDGVRALRSTFTFADRKGECDWEPDVVEAVFPLRPGATWTSTSTCAVTGAAPTPIPLRRTVNAEVVDLRRTRVAGVVVDVWAIKRVERLEGGGITGETSALALFSPKHGLDVEVTGSGSGGGRSGDYRQELLSLEPTAT